MEAGQDLELKRSWRNRIGLWLGPLLAIAIQFVPVPASLIESAGSDETARNAWIVLSLLTLMSIWWVSEAVPIPVTSLLPLVIVPFFDVMGTGRLGTSAAVNAISSQYLHAIVVLLLGGLIVAKAIERWNLHARIALNVLARVGARPSMLVAGFMLAAALLSMWISNTATSIMMMPIALSVAAAVLGRDNLDQPFTYALLLGIAYACSIGGLGTPVGTPTNLIIMGQLNEDHGFSIGFGDWMLLGVPVVLALLPAAWFVLTRWAFPLKASVGDAGRDVILQKRAELGRMTTPEWRTLGVFAVIAVLWVFQRPLKGVEIAGISPFVGLTDHITAIFGVILCFLVPSGARAQPGSRLLDWKTAETIPWGVLLLFGGGMALARAITVTGLSTWLGEQMSSLALLPLIAIIALLTIFVIFLTEVTSNVATASALMPVMGALALSSGIDVELLAAPLAMAASCAFMLPMATGPNAVVFSTGRVSLPTMAGAGFRLNLIAIVLITFAAYLLTPLAFSAAAPTG